MTVSYVAGVGFLVTLPGQSVMLSETMTLHALEKHLSELVEYFGE